MYKKKNFEFSSQKGYDFRDHPGPLKKVAAMRTQLERMQIPNE